MCLEGISLAYVVSRVDYDVTCICRQPTGLTSVPLVVGTCGNCKIVCPMYGSLQLQRIGVSYSTQERVS